MNSLLGSFTYVHSLERVKC